MLYLRIYRKQNGNSVLGTCNCQYGFDAFTAYGVVHHAKVFSRIFDFGFLNDKGTGHLFYSIIQCDGVFTTSTVDEFVPSEIFLLILKRCLEIATFMEKALRENIL